MRLRLLGSSAGKTVPRPFCRCRVCRLARERGGRNLRTRTGMQIFLDGDEGDEARYHVDLPPDTGHHMVTHRFGMERLEHLLITHPDEDHFDPIYLRNRKIVLSDRDDLLPLTIYGGDTTRAKFDALGLKTEYLKLAFREVRSFERFSAGELEVLSLRASHGPGCLNYVVSHGGRSVLLAWDTGLWPEETWDAIRGLGLDAVFVECTVLGPVRIEPKGHLDFTAVLHMRRRLMDEGCILPETPYVLVHIGDNGELTHDEAVAFAVPHGIIVGYDGLEVEV